MPKMNVPALRKLPKIMKNMVEREARKKAAKEKEKIKIKDPSGVKRKDFRGSKAKGGLMEATARLKRQGLKGGGMSSRGLGRAFMKGGRV